jgi:hypothetical protein
MELHQMGIIAKIPEQLERHKKYIEISFTQLGIHVLYRLNNEAEDE